MRRYPPFEPPEYIDWTPDPMQVERFASTLNLHPERCAVVDALDQRDMLALHRGMVRNRLHDISLKRWVRRGVISKAWLGTGEEAATIGCVHALDRENDVVAPMIRNAGACHEMGMSLADMFRAYLGTSDGPTGGRDLHAGSLEHGVIQPISPVGAMVPVIAGIALSFKRRGEPRVALTWVGDGATKTSTFHEGINLAAVQGVPAIFVLQNNQVALGTRLDQHQRGDFGEWPKMYGMRGARADGNNVLDVYAATRLAADHARAGGGPTLLVVDTFRMGGHATHDEAEARATFPPELFAEWGQRDPIGLFEEYLVSQGEEREDLERTVEEVAAEVEREAERALDSREDSMPSAEVAEFEGISAGRRQPGLAHRIDAG